MVEDFIFSFVRKIINNVGSINDTFVQFFLFFSFVFGLSTIK